MVTKRTMKCNCGGSFTEQETEFDGFRTEALICVKCGFTTLTKQQARKFARLKELHTIIDAERRIIRIGNSMGFTLPDTLRSFGVKIGKRIRTEAVSPNSFRVELLD